MRTLIPWCRSRNDSIPSRTFLCRRPVSLSTILAPSQLMFRVHSTLWSASLCHISLCQPDFAYMFIFSGLKQCLSDVHRMLTVTWDSVCNVFLSFTEWFLTCGLNLFQFSSRFECYSERVSTGDPFESFGQIFRYGMVTVPRLSSFS